MRVRKPKGSERRGKLCVMTSIRDRPEEIEGRLAPGRGGRLAQFAEQRGDSGSTQKIRPSPGSRLCGGPAQRASGYKGPRPARPPSVPAVLGAAQGAGPPQRQPLHPFSRPNRWICKTLGAHRGCIIRPDIDAELNMTGRLCVETRTPKGRSGQARLTHSQALRLAWPSLSESGGHRVD